MIEAKQESFWKLVDRGAEVKKVLGGFRFTEGPVFSRRGFLLFTDIPANRIIKWQKGNDSKWTQSVLRENSNSANGLTFDHQGRLLACETGRVTRTEKDGAIIVLADGVKGPNDLVYCIDGGTYFTDYPAGKVYLIPRKGTARVVAEGDKPNGVALSPDQMQLYVGDSGKRLIRVYGVAASGDLTNGRDFCSARCDGLKTDEGGNVWITSGGGVRVYDKQGGELGFIGTPEEPSNCCWGEGFRGLYITAGTSVYHVATRSNGTRTY